MCKRYVYMSQNCIRMQVHVLNCIKVVNKYSVKTHGSDTNLKLQKTHVATIVSYLCVVLPIHYHLINQPTDSYKHIVKAERM